MKKIKCPLEYKILDCLKYGEMNHEMEQHIKDCSICQDTTVVYQWMNDFKKVSTQSKEHEKRVPTPEFIWEKAKTYSRFNKEMIKKIMFPLLIPRILTYIVSSIVIIVFISSNIYEIKNFFIKNIWTGHIFNSATLIIQKLFMISKFIAVPMVFILSLFVFCYIYFVFDDLKKI